MDTITLSDIVRNNVVDGDKLFKDGVEVIRDWMTDRINEASVKTTFAVKKFIDSIPEKLYPNGELIKTSLGEVEIYKDDEIKLSYDFDRGSMRLEILGVPDNVNEAVVVCNATKRGSYTYEISRIPFVQHYGSRLLINTTISTSSWYAGKDNKITGYIFS